MVLMKRVATLAILVMLLGVAFAGWRTGAIARVLAPSVTADAHGGIGATLGDVRLDAPAGTFAASQRLALDTGPHAGPSLGPGRLVGSPLAVIDPGRIAHPVLVTTSRSPGVEPARAIAVVWNGSSASPLPVEVTPGGRLRARVGELSWVGFVVFGSPAELTGWLVQHARGTPSGAQSACPSTGRLTLVKSNAPAGSNVLRVVAQDGRAAGTIDVHICNRQMYAVEYSATGAADASGIVAGGAVARFSLEPKGLAGDPLTVAGGFSARAAFWTIAFGVAQVLPGGGEVRDALRGGGSSLTESSAGSALEAAGVACRDALDRAARAADTSNGLTAAGTCLLHQTSFQAAMQAWWAATAAALGFGPDDPAPVTGVVANADAMDAALRSLVAGWRDPSFFCCVSCLPPPAPPAHAGYVLAGVAFADPHPRIEVATMQKQQGGQSPYMYSIRYPRLLDAGAHNEGFNTAVNGVLNDVIGSFLADVARAPGSGVGPSLQPQLVCLTTEAYLDADLVSVRLDCGAAFGGGSPDEAPRTVTWDLRQGHQLQLADLFLPHAPYPTVLANECNPLYGELNGAFQPPWQHRPPTGDDFGAWVLTPKGLELVFAKYAVGPGAAGEPQVIVSYSMLANFVQDGGPTAHASDLADALTHG
jgi:hypothetical protein